MKNEISLKPISGYVMLMVLFVLIAIMVGGLVVLDSELFLLIFLLIVLTIRGFFIVNPNGSKVLVLFGAYKGTVRENGFSGLILSFPDREFRSEPGILTVSG